MMDRRVSPPPLSDQELDRLQEVAGAGRHGIVRPAGQRGYARLLEARYVTTRPVGLQAFSYVITYRGRRALAAMGRS